MCSYWQLVGLEVEQGGQFLAPCDKSFNDLDLIPSLELSALSVNRGAVVDDVGNQVFDVRFHK